MLTLNTRYTVTAPNGTTGFITIKNTGDKEFYEKWEARGYSFRELRISRPVDNVCVACEG